MLRLKYHKNINATFGEHQICHSINFKINLILTWYENCILTDIKTQAAVPAQERNPPKEEINAPKSIKFKMADTKLYVTVVTLSIQDDNKLLEKLKIEFKRTIKWNKCRSKLSNKTKKNNLNYLIEPTSIKINRLFVISFENEGDRIDFLEYYTPTVEI